MVHSEYICHEKSLKMAFRVVETNAEAILENFLGYFEITDRFNFLCHHSTPGSESEYLSGSSLGMSNYHQLSLKVETLKFE